MKKDLLALFFMFFLLSQLLFAQNEAYTVTLTPFSTKDFDEFSPVYYKDGIVFCSNMRMNSFFTYTDRQNSFFNIYYYDIKEKVSGENPKLFSRNLSSKLNDGPVTFNRREDTIYFSRNLEVRNKLKVISGPQNKLGIFSAHKEGDNWIGIREFRLNNEWYNITSPCLSPDGKRLYFATDKPGGYGGSDLYVCQWKGSYWSDPENLGDIINTKGNESYPYVNSSGELLFSSDGHGGMGGKDIFLSRHADTAWLVPVRLDRPVNSEYDDFGLISDAIMEEGYFSSNRNGTIDIFHFKTNLPQVFYSTLQKENQYCYIFNDNGAITIDSTIFRYSWDFGDGIKSGNAIADHCYKSPGNYIVNLDIIELATGKLFFRKLSYDLEIRKFEQPYISCPDIVVKGDNIDLDGEKSNLPGFEILNYSWNFGDGTRSSGEKVKHSYKEAGEFSINLELTIKSNSTGDIQKTGVSKKIVVLADSQEKAAYNSKKSTFNIINPNVRQSENVYIKTIYSAEKEIQQDAIFCIELLSSKVKVALTSTYFKNIPSKYKIRERIMEDGSYSYTVCQQMSLMATFPSFRELASIGIKGMRILTIIITDPAEKELYNLVKLNGVNTENYFDSSNKLKLNGYIMLDQLVKLMNKYPAKKLEVAVHSDNTDSELNGQALTQKQAQLLVDYMIGKAISAKRLTAKGYGESIPVAPNFLKRERLLNQRIDFEIY